MQYDIRREAAKISALSSKKYDKYEYLTGEGIFLSNQRQIKEQAKFTYSSLAKIFEKQRKAIEEQGKKQIDAIANPNERLVALTNEDHHKDNYKKIFQELVKKRFDEIKELTYEINQNDLIRYFKCNAVRKRFDDFNNGIEFFKKIKYREMKLDEAKNCRTCINQI